MKLVYFVIILGVISIIPSGIFISGGIFIILLFYKIKDLKIVKVEINQKRQKDYDDKILEEMK